MICSSGAGCLGVCWACLSLVFLGVVIAEGVKQIDPGASVSVFVGLWWLLAVIMALWGRARAGGVSVRLRRKPEVIEVGAEAGSECGTEGRSGRGGLARPALGRRSEV